MAPLQTRPLPRSILMLDKSDEPFEALLIEASRILGIQINNDSRYPARLSEISSSSSSFVPLDEWALKWLLKQLLGNTIRAESPCLSPQAWSLLQTLITRIPISVIARLIRTHNFTSILQKTLQYFQQDEVLTEGVHLPAERGKVVVEDSPANADSSSGTVGNAPPKTKSTKRKRDAEERLEAYPAKPTLAGTTVLFERICAVVKQLLEFTHDLPDGSRGYAVEHMIAALRTSPQQAAAILGQSFTIASLLLSGNAYATDLEITSVRSQVAPMIDFWNLCSSTWDEQMSIESNRSFSELSLNPSLMFLVALEQQTRSCSGFAASSTTNVVERVQTLIRTCVILPFRASQLGKMRKRTFNRKEAPDLQAIELLRPLADIPKGDRKTRSTLGLIRCLFTIAVECCSSETAKDQRRENPWLQDLLDYLVRYEPLPTHMVVINQQASILNADIIPMMEQVIRTKIPVKTSTLEVMLTNYSGLFGNHRGKDAWEITSLCLQANADVFLIRKSSPETDGHDAAKCSRFLEALLMKMTQDCMTITRDTRMRDKERYGTITTISRLLAKAFADARDLSVFVGHWHEQLMQTSQIVQRNVELGCVFNAGVWEDDQLIQTVKDLLKPTLTVRQIITLLEKSHSKLSSSDTTHEVWASSVIVGCLIWGCSEDTTNPELRNAVQSVFLKTLLLIKGGSHCRERWRLWRISAAVLERWPGLTDLTVLDELLDRASLLLGRATQPHRDNDFTYHEEALHGFRLATTILHDRSTLSSKTAAKESNAVQIILDTMEQFCNSATAGEVAESEYSWILGWDGTTETVRSRDLLVLGCAAHVLHSPNTLRYFQDVLKRRFIEALYWSAYTQVKVNRQRGLIRYDVLWDHLLSSEHVRGDHVITNSIRRVLAACLAGSATGILMQRNISKHFDDPGHNFIVRTLIQIPVHVYDRDLRFKASNFVLETFRHVDRSSYGSLLLDGSLYRLDVLIRLMEYPSLDMHLIKDGKALWDVASVLQRLSAFNSGVEISLNLVKSFGLLIHHVLSHVISTIDHQQSRDFLKHLYDLTIDKKDILPAISSEQATEGNKIQIFYHILISKTLIIVQENAAKVFKETETIRSAIPHVLSEYRNAISLTLKHLIKGNQTILGGTIGDFSIAAGILLEYIIDYHAVIGFQVKMNREYSQPPSYAPMLAEIENYCSNYAQSRDPEILSSLDFLKVQIARVSLLSSDGTSQPTVQILQASKLQGDIKSRRESQLLSEYIRKAMAKLNAEHLQELLSMLLRNGKENYPGNEELCGLQNFIIMEQGCLKSVGGDTCSRIYGALCHILHDPSCSIDFRCTIITLRCLDYLLRHKATTIKQPNIDDTMSAIAITTQRLIKRQDRRASIVHRMLCNVFSTVLAAHRTRLGGRYHLVLAALNALLRVFFVPYTQTSTLLTNTASWKEEATAYARLLTTICNPSPSAVAGKRRGTQQQLNDATKIERRKVGDLLRIVIQEYCVCQLIGSLIPDVREALMPGIYAIFNIMPDDVKRVISAALEPESRSIYQALWREWKLFGDKWDGT